MVVLVHFQEFKDFFRTESGKKIEYLEKTFRWFGSDFGVTLQDIKQTGATGAVTALHKIPTGQVWSSREIKKLKEEIESSGLRWSVVESVNVHESIKTAAADSRQYVNNYIETLHNLAENGLKTVCYNFMPVLDWTRTDLHFPLNDGSYALHYSPLALAAFDLYLLKREEATKDYNAETKRKANDLLSSLSDQEVVTLQNTIMAGLPGTKDVLSLDEFRWRHKKYASIDETQLKKNLVRFLSQVIPEAEKLGIKMCIHPDDPPYSILGLPRVVNNISNIRYMLESVPSYYNGLTYCCGSLGAYSGNDLVKIFKTFAHRVHFLHLRSVHLEADQSFLEANHLEGSAPIAKIMEAIIEEQVKRVSKDNKDVNIPMRSDHGHLMLSDIPLQDTFYPGYSTIGRMKGLAELSGLELGLRHKIIENES